MSTAFTNQDRDDLREIFRIHDFSKVDKVDDVISTAEARGESAQQIIHDYFTLYRIRQLPYRDAIGKRLRLAVPAATLEDIESTLRRTEMKGYGERDAVRALERKYGIQHVTSFSVQPRRHSTGDATEKVAASDSELLRTTSALRHVSVNDSSASLLMHTPPNASAAPDKSSTVEETEEEEPSVIFARPPSHLSAAPTRENMDEIMAEEVREWVGKMVGDAHNTEVLAKANFVDALRTGVLLHVLLQKMEDPPVADEELKLPKRATGFFIRDNVATFLAEAKTRYHLVDAQLFTDSDLVDGKSDRQVVTCLVAMARTAYAAGTIKLAPSIIMFEHEIEQRSSALTKQDLDRLVEEAEAFGEGADALGPREEADIPVLKVDTAKAAEGEEEKATDSHVHAEATDVAEEQAVEKAKEGDNEESTPVAEEKKRQGKEETEEKQTSPQWEDGTATADGRKTPRTPMATREQSTREITSPPDRPQTLSPKPSNLSTSASPSPVAVAEEKSNASTDARRDGRRAGESLRPASEDLHTPPERGVSTGAGGGDTASSTPAPADEEGALSGSDGEAGDEGRVLYLRAGHLMPSRPTPMEEQQLQQQRKNAGPRVVWKSPNAALAAGGGPPKYYSRHWDGIDVALGRYLNAHYETHPQSPWRFHMVAATAGEYLLYNRQNAQKKVVYMRIIQSRLFLRNSGKNQPWVRVEEALAELEKSK